MDFHAVVETRRGHSGRGTRPTSTPVWTQTKHGGHGTGWGRQPAHRMSPGNPRPMAATAKTTPTAQRMRSVMPAP